MGTRVRLGKGHDETDFVGLGIFWTESRWSKMTQ